VLAAGGIAGGAQMAAALALGAAGVWCGSVWLRSEEDITPREIKEKFLAADSGSTVRSPTRTGKPARQLRSAWHDAWESPGAPPALPMPLQPLLVNDAWNRIDAAAEAGHPGALELESFFIGQVVGGFHRLEPAYDIAAGLIRDCEARLRQMSALVTP
jgi:NAD(P)H-dependent flavin oxidoreductase YrpB (nitropropane dioxygenase family)